MNRLLVFILCIQFSYSQAQTPWLYENSYDHSYQILESYDGGTILLATENGQSNTGKIIKLNNNGEILWVHTLEENDTHFKPISMVEDSYGSIIIGGMTNKYEEEYVDGYIIKLNSCGELLWFKHIGVIEQNDYMTHMLLGSENQVFIVHYIPNGIGNFTLMRINTDGTIIWAKTHLEEGGGSPDGLIKCSDGGFIVHGSYYAPPYYDPESSVHYIRNAIVKIDSLGEEEWTNIYRWKDDAIDTIYRSSGGGCRK